MNKIIEKTKTLTNEIFDYCDIVDMARYSLEKAEHMTDSIQEKYDLYKCTEMSREEALLFGSRKKEIGMDLTILEDYIVEALSMLRNLKDGVERA